MNIDILSPEETLELEELGVKTMNTSGWSPEQMGRAYFLTNMIFGVHKVDTGCSGCRREVLNNLKKAYQALQIKLKLNGTS